MKNMNKRKLCDLSFDSLKDKNKHERDGFNDYEFEIIKAPSCKLFKYKNKHERDGFNDYEFEIIKAPSYQLLKNKNKHERDKHLTFNAVEHTYEAHGEVLISATTFLATFKNIFDPDVAISKMKFDDEGFYNGKNKKYLNMTVDSIKESWVKLGEKASELGTTVHDVIENYYDQQVDKGKKDKNEFIQ